MDLNNKLNKDFHDFISKAISIKDGAKFLKSKLDIENNNKYESNYLERDKWIGLIDKTMSDMNLVWKNIKEDVKK